MSDENKDKVEPSVLGEKELEAIRLKFEGASYKVISESIGIDQGTVGNWFYKNGKLYNFYNDYCEEQAKIRAKEANNLFKAHISTAVKTLVEIMLDPKQHTPSRVNASVQIINRQLGEPKRVVQNEIVDPVAEILAKAGLLDEATEDKKTD